MLQYTHFFFVNEQSKNGSEMDYTFHFLTEQVGSIDLCFILLPNNVESTSSVAVCAVQHRFIA